MTERPPRETPPSEADTFVNVPPPSVSGASPSPSEAATWVTPRADAPRGSGDPGAPELDPSITRTSSGRHGSADAAADLVGSRIGAWIIGEPLGEGGMGRVYRGRHEQLGVERAIKVLVAGRDAPERELARFLREARAAMRLRHDGIVGVHELGEDGGRHFIVMDQLDGRSLAEEIAAAPGGKLPPRRALEIVVAVGRALQYANEAGVVHRDVKPQNVMIRGDGRPAVLDFGLALDLSSEETRLTVSAALVGTPAYMAPEQARGDRGSVGPWTDVFGLGATLYHALCGVAPFEREAFHEVVYAVLKEPIQRPRDHGAEIPLDAEAICLKALEREPTRRYQDPGELADDAQRFLDGEPVLAPRPSLARREWKALRENRPTSPVTNLVVVAAAVVICFIVWRYIDMVSVDRDLDRLEAGGENERIRGIAMLRSSSRANYAQLLDMGRNDASPDVRRSALGSLAAKLEGIDGLAPPWLVGGLVATLIERSAADPAAGRERAAILAALRAIAKHTDAGPEVVEREDDEAWLGFWESYRTTSVQSSPGDFVE